MKLNTKFSLSIASFVLVSAFLSLFTIFSFMNVIKLRNYQIQTSNTITEWFKLRIYLSDIFTVSFDTTTAGEQWTARKDSFSTSFKTVTDSPLRKRLKAGTNEKITNAGNLYKLIEASFDSLDTEITDLLASDLGANTRTSLKTNGISDVFNNIKSEDSNTLALFYLRLNGAIYKMNVYSDPFQNLLAEFKDALEEDVSRTVYLVTVESFVLLILISILIFFVVTRITSRITGRLKVIERTSEDIANKNLTRILDDHTGDEIGDLASHLSRTIGILNTFMSSVKLTADEATGMSESINDSAGEVTAATTEITSNIGSMQNQFANLQNAVDNASAALASMSTFLVTFMTDINHQNSLISESSASITEMNRSITLISRKGREKAEQIGGLKRIAVEGEEKIETTESLLVDVTTKLDDVHAFIEMINSIAEQTSILSMNAAIESAHAGEAGKGFAVVADEIQKLAESTTENAQLITETLTGIIGNVQEARNSSQIATTAFNNTTSVIDELSRTLNEIVEAITLIDQRSSGLSAQASGVAGSIGDLSEKTDKLDSLRKTVIREIGQIEDIFSESKNGIAEINIGTEDILDKIMKIHELSTQSKSKMANLHTMLNEFDTHTSVTRLDQAEGEGGSLRLSAERLKGAENDGKIDAALMDEGPETGLTEGSDSGNSAPPEAEDGADLLEEL